MRDTNVQSIYQKTIAFAAEHHGQQKMPNGLPYIVHLSNVAMEVFMAEFEALRACPGGLWIGVWHPFVSGRLSRWQRVEKAIEYIMSSGDVWFATMEEIAIHVNKVTAEGIYTPRVDRLPYHTEPQVPQELIGKAEA